MGPTHPREALTLLLLACRQQRQDETVLGQADAEAKQEQVG